MARQPYFVNTSQKQMDVEVSFGGGMCPQAHPEKLRDDQSQIIENADIVAGGVLQARGAYDRTDALGLSNNSQGRFKYQTLAGGTDIVACNGLLWTVSGGTATQLTITGLASFQTTRPIEAVQYRDKMYFATGSGLVMYDGTTASLVNAYAPNGLEALYIGTNGLALQPDNYMSDTTGAADVILGVTASSRYGMINQNVTFTTYIQQISGDSLEYLFEFKQVVSADYTKGRDWSSAKTWTANFGIKADYMIRVSLRKAGTTTVLSQYVLPRYKVQTTPDETPEAGVNFNDLKTCNRIFVHYDRLCIYGCTTNPDYLFISHLNNFTYFPRTNIIKVTDPLRGGLQKVAQFRNYLVCYTNGSIQMITGQSPADFTKTPIHTTIGTTYPYSVQVMTNYMLFVGNDNAVYRLQPIRTNTMAMDVHRIDESLKDQISSLLVQSTNVLSAMYNTQYYLYIESSGQYNMIYRYYYDMDVWVRDSVQFNFISMMTYNNTLLLCGKTAGNLYKLDNTKFKDSGSQTYQMRILSKDFDFGMPHHRKKLKQYQLLAKMTNVTTISVDTYLDNTLLSNTVLNYDSNQNSDAQKLKVMASGRFRYAKVDVKITVNELVQLIGFGFVYKLNTPK